MQFRYLATSCYILFIVLINVIIVNIPGVPAFGESFSLADVMIGLVYLLRDFSQREIKHYVIVAMIIGTVLSYIFADKTIALASVSAFIVGESIDWAIFTFTKKPLAQRLVLSASISSPIDSAIFLWVSGRLHWLPFCVMTICKIIGVLLLWWVWKWRTQKKSAAVLQKNPAI